MVSYISKGEIYQKMLIEEEGIECLQEVIKNSSLDKNVRSLVMITLNFMTEKYPDSVTVAGK